MKKQAPIYREHLRFYRSTAAEPGNTPLIYRKTGRMSGGNWFLVLFVFILYEGAI